MLQIHRLKKGKQSPKGKHSLGQSGLTEFAFAAYFAFFLLDIKSDDVDTMLNVSLLLDDEKF